MSIDTHPITDLTNNNGDNGIYFVLGKDSFNLPLLVTFKDALMAAHPTEQHQWNSQLIIRRESEGLCTLTLETYPNGGCDTLFESTIRDDVAMSLYDNMEANRIEIILQGPCFD